MTACFAFLQLNPWEILLIVGLGLLLFGRKLPDVGRYLGRSMIEFKKGMKGLEDEVESGGNAANPMAPMTIEQPRPPQRVTNAPPPFDDNPSISTNQPK